MMLLNLWAFSLGSRNLFSQAPLFIITEFLWLFMQRLCCGILIMHVPCSVLIPQKLSFCFVFFCFCCLEPDSTPGCNDVIHLPFTLLNTYVKAFYAEQSVINRELQRNTLSRALSRSLSCLSRLVCLYRFEGCQIALQLRSQLSSSTLLMKHGCLTNREYPRVLCAFVRRWQIFPEWPGKVWCLNQISRITNQCRNLGHSLHQLSKARLPSVSIYPHCGDYSLTARYTLKHFGMSQFEIFPWIQCNTPYEYTI